MADDVARQEQATLTARWLDTAARPDLHPPPVQRQQARPDALHAEGSALDRARQTCDVDDIKAIDDFAGATDTERLDFIRILLDQAWVGPRDEAALERIWDSFGARVLSVAGRRRDLWEQSIQRGAELDDLPAIAKVKQAFRDDVCTLARDILARNEDHVLAEMQALGIAEDGTPDRVTVPSEDDYLADIQELARQAVAAQHALKELRRVPVGFDPVPTRFDSLAWQVVTFDPVHQPLRDHLDTADDMAMESAGLRGQQGMRAWTEVKAHHDRLHELIASLAVLSPALHTVLAEDDERQLADVAAASPQQARRIIAQRLQATLQNIRDTRPKIGGDLDDRDLIPLHQQLFAGIRGASGVDWSEPLHQWAAQDLLSEHETTEFWISLGLGTAAAAAFVVAEIATFGTATFFLALGIGAGIGGTMSALGWEQWEDLDMAAGASASPESQLVSQGQVDAALVAAMVDSAFAFLDLIPGVRAVRAAAGARPVRSGVAEAGEEVIEAGSGRTLQEGSEEAIETGVSKAAHNGLAQGVSTGAPRLRPEQAANWNDLQSYLGKPVNPARLPPGYRTYTKGGRTFIRRITADDQRFARLTVDPNGIIQVGVAPSKRLSNARRVARNVRQHLLPAGQSRPPNHQAHHYMPDQVARDHPLMREAYNRGLYDIDHQSNLVLLAKSQASQVNGISKGLPIHNGSHPTYTKMVMSRADAIWSELQDEGYTLIADVPDDLLATAAQEVQDAAKQVFEHWIKDNGQLLK